MALGNKWSRPPACVPCGPRPLDPPVGGTFHFENLIMPPLTKTCPKMVLSDKGGSLCVKDVFAKKFFGAGRDSAGGALASVLRKHSTEGRTSVAPQWQSTLGEQDVNTISSPCRSAMTITFCSPETSTSQSQNRARLGWAVSVRLRLSSPLDCRPNPMRRVRQVQLMNPERREGVHDRVGDGRNGPGSAGFTGALCAKRIARRGSRAVVQ